MGGWRDLRSARPRCTYASPVAYAHHVLRLTPINHVRQQVHAAALEVTGAGGRREP
jgi:hypothetical protein